MTKERVKNLMDHVKQNLLLELPILAFQDDSVGEQGRGLDRGGTYRFWTTETGPNRQKRQRPQKPS